MSAPWITFDCFGTLVDWHSGFSAIVRPFAGDRTEDLLRAYHRFEPQIEAERPHQLYRDVLATSLLLAAREIGIPLCEAEARALPDAWDSLPVFADVEPALAELRALGFRLGVLTNCDEDLFQRTQACFRQPFDMVVTAERVRDYKPSPAHFRYFYRASGVEMANWVHVACSWFHDIAPAREFGLARIWVDRDNTGEDLNSATARLTSAVDLAETVRRVLGEMAATSI